MIALNSFEAVSNVEKNATLISQPSDEGLVAQALQAFRSVS